MSMMNNTSLEKLDAVVDKIFVTYDPSRNILTPRSDNVSCCCKHLEKNTTKTNANVIRQQITRSTPCSRNQTPC